VHSRHEKKVAGLLSDKSIEHYLPLQKINKQWSDRKKIVEEPLFKSYVFVRVNEFELDKVRDTKGVMNFVYWLGKPAIIRENEITAIQNFIQEYQDIEVENIAPELYSTIKVSSGPFENQTGLVVKVEKNKVKILVETMGCYLIADITKNKMLNLPQKQV
jgi:transcription antitermination factor NusG